MATNVELINNLNIARRAFGMAEIEASSDMDAAINQTVGKLVEMINADGEAEEIDWEPGQPLPLEQIGRFVDKIKLDPNYSIGKQMPYLAAGALAQRGVTGPMLQNPALFFQLMEKATDMISTLEKYQENPSVFSQAKVSPQNEEAPERQATRIPVINAPMGVTPGADWLARGVLWVKGLLDGNEEPKIELSQETQTEQPVKGSQQEQPKDEETKPVNPADLDQTAIAEASLGVIGRLVQAQDQVKDNGIRVILPDEDQIGNGEFDDQSQQSLQQLLMLSEMDTGIKGLIKSLTKGEEEQDTSWQYSSKKGEALIKRLVDHKDSAAIMGALNDNLNQRFGTNFEGREGLIAFKASLDHLQRENQLKDRQMVESPSTAAIFNGILSLPQKLGEMFGQPGQVIGGFIASIAGILIKALAPIIKALFPGALPLAYDPIESDASTQVADNGNTPSGNGQEVALNLDREPPKEDAPDQNPDTINPETSLVADYQRALEQNYSATASYITENPGFWIPGERHMSPEALANAPNTGESFKTASIAETPHSESSPERESEPGSVSVPDPIGRA